MRMCSLRDWAMLSALALALGLSACTKREEGDRVVVLAFVEGVGIGQEITIIFGMPGGIRIGDAVVEIFEFAEAGLIARKWDIIEPISEESYDFR